MEDNTYLNFYSKLKNANYKILYLIYFNENSSQLIYFIFEIIKIFQLFSLTFNEKVVEIWNSGKLDNYFNNFFKYWKILPYTKNNQNFFILILLLTYFLIISTYVIYLFLLTISFLDKKVKRFKMLFELYSIFSNFISRILYIPFLEILLTILICDDENYFNNKFKCWKFEHIIFGILSLFSILFLIHISFNYYSFYYKNQDNFSNNISKYVILNPDLNLCYIIFLSFLFNKILYIKNVLVYYVISLCILSLINTYNFFTACNYNKSNKIFCKIYFLISLIFFFNSFCLSIGYLIKEKSFDGLLEIFLIGSILLSFLVLTIPNKNYLNKVSNLYLNSELGTYEHIFLIVKEIEQYKNKRENLLNIFGFFSDETINLNKKNADEINYNELNEVDLKAEILKHIEYLYQYAINYYKNSVLLIISFSLFQFEVLNRFDKAYINLTKALEIKNLSMSQEFFIYRIKKKIEYKIFEDGNDLTNISAKYQSNNIINMIFSLSLYFSNFWNIVLNCTEYHEVQKINYYGNKISKLLDKMETKFKLLDRSRINNSKIKYLYGIFLKEILNDNEKSIIYLSNTVSNEQNEIILNKNYIDLKTLKVTPDFQFIIISGKKNKFGNILKISLEFCNLIGYSQNSLIGKNYELILPDFIIESHSQMIESKLKYFKSNESIEKNLKKIEALLVTSSKYLTSIYLDVCITNNEDFTPIIFGKINYFQSNQNFIILTNNKLTIRYYTSNCILQLKLHTKDLNTEITPLIKQFNEECMKKLQNSNKSENAKYKVKIKILQEKYLKENDILWKNKIHLKLIVKEIKINDKLYGFEFIFNNDIENTKIEMSNTRLSLVKRNSIASESINGFLLNKKFVPNVDNITFDIKEKMFYLDKNYNKNVQSVEEYFNNNYYLETKETSNKKEKTTSNENSSKLSASDITSEESSNSNSNESKEEDDEEIQKKKKEEELLAFDTKKDENSIENEYYKINFENIKFSVYDYTTGIVIDVKNFPKESKVSTIISQERLKQIPSSPIGKINTKVRTKLNQDGVITIENTQNKLTERNLEIINKIVSPKIINTSILFCFLLYLVVLLVFIGISAFYFNRTLNYRDNITSINNFISYQTSLFRYILHTYLASMELVLLNNTKYTNLYQKDYRQDYYAELQLYLMEIYNKSIEELESLSFNEIHISHEIQEQIDAIYVDISLYHITDDYDIEIDTTSLKLLYSLSEFDYYLFSFANDATNCYPLNTKFLYLVFNGENNINGINTMINLYFQELDKEIANVDKIIKILFFVFCLFEVVIIILSVKANIFFIREKEKYLNYFFKVNEEKINDMLQINFKFLSFFDEHDNILGEKKIKLDESESENTESQNPIKKSKKGFTYQKKKKGDLHNFKYNSIMDNSDIRTNLIIVIIFYLFMSALLLILTLYFSSQIINIPHYDRVFYLTLYLERTIFGKFNFVRAYNFFHPFQYSIETIAFYFWEQINYLYDAYQENSGLVTKMSRNFTDFDLNKIYPLYRNLNKDSFCHYLEENAGKYNINCEKLSCNITNYGFYSIFSFLFDNYFLLIEQSKEIWEKAEQSNYSYNELIYDTELYYESYEPKDEKEKEIYHANNPFTIFNTSTLKDITIILVYVFRYVFQNLTTNLNDVIDMIMDQIKKVIVLIAIVFYIVLGLFYIIYLIPFIIIKNTELNKIKKMIKLIPKDMLLQIINNEKFIINKKTKTENEK